VARVCRARPGDQVEATDGRGALARIRLLSVGKAVRAEVEAVERVERGQGISIWCGAPERGRADWLVEKLAELGVERFQPLDIEGAPWGSSAARGERWNRLAIAALRQSRRPFLMAVRPPLPLGTALETLGNAGARWLGDPNGRAAGTVDRPGSEAFGAIGPAAGFGRREREQLEAAGFIPIALSDGRLRTETAALSLAAWMALPRARGG
jgi:16S rRNA (uracil1498-N3)-methyltransferase